MSKVLDVELNEKVETENNQTIKSLLKQRVYLIERIHVGEDLNEEEVKELKRDAKDCLVLLKAQGWVRPQK